MLDFSKPAQMKSKSLDIDGVVTTNTDVDPKIVIKEQMLLQNRPDSSFEYSFSEVYTLVYITTFILAVYLMIYLRDILQSKLNESLTGTLNGILR